MKGLTSALGLGLLFVALLACGGGSSDACSATVQYKGKSATAKDVDRVAAWNTACGALCGAHPGMPAAERDLEYACASRCDAETMLGSGTATIVCK